ncbi:hypothetical protein COF68_05845 [Bacillus toyonensis]|uniref:DNA polymerase III subunit n=1 Tax=Bacillus toyonensis TaxID=155322 RepID=UPI000BFE5535|nr:AAA family ATPase [Bacillus toyonensis]PHE64362.1 hypothetical protein COF68_05845 [Bacillus toyonensis]
MSHDKLGSNENLNLTRKYRPKSMDEYVGNEALKKTVFSWMDNANKPQAILLKGSTGGGKTTMARIVAKEYLCEDRDPEKGACGVCASCKEMDDYIGTGNTDALINVKEVNASKDSGLSAINALLEEAQYPSFGDEWKIYILDECHRISIPAQNSLLKLVEEPPERVLFMFCTTDPEKMLDTLLNRCNIKLDVKKPSEEQMAQLLGTVCKRESIDFDRKGLSLIVDRSELVIRQALMDLENVIVQQGNVAHASVLKVFDEKPNSLYFEFYRCLLDKDVFKFISVLHKIKSKMHLKEFVRNLTNFTKRGIYIYHSITLEGITENEIRNMKELFKRFTVEQQGIMLEFLTRANDGDVETNLMLLGFKGLTREVNNELKENNVIKESKTDVLQEDKVTGANKNMLQKERINTSKDDVKSAVEKVGVEDAIKFFEI